MTCAPAGSRSKPSGLSDELLRLPPNLHGTIRRTEGTYDMRAVVPPRQPIHNKVAK